MPDAQTRLSRLLPLLAAVLAAIAVVAAYSNSTRNVFILDDWHTIQTNPHIRRLSNLPRFFTDAETVSVYTPNVDYRPFLTTTYALNYAWSAAAHGDGYDTRTWHWTNLFLHWTVCLNLFLLGRRLFGSGGLAPIPGLPAAHGDWIALAGALLFAVHPITTGCGNYMSARSTLLVATFALPALNRYLRTLSHPRQWWPLIPALLAYLLALFSKIEAVSLGAVVVAAEILLAPGAQALPLWRRPFRAEPWRRTGPFVALTVVYIAFWKYMSPLEHSAGRAATGVEPHHYLVTQFSAWWYYIGKVLAPVHLIADRQDFPIARTLLDPRAMLALTGWILVIAAALRLARSAPAVTFLVAAYFLYLLPHSSVVVLAEMVNEHRPYIATSGLFLLAAAGLYLAAARLTPRPLPVVAAGAVLLAVPLVLLTRDRNTVWSSGLKFWADVVSKSPTSPRAQMSYGLELMWQGNLDEAEARFRESLKYAPNYSYAHTNLAICLDAKGDVAGAAQYHNSAVEKSPEAAMPYYWRGTFRAKHGDLQGAISDFAFAVDRSTTPYRELAALAECLLEAGRTEEAQRAIAIGLRVDPRSFEVERARFRATYLTPR